MHFLLRGFAFAGLLGMTACTSKPVGPDSVRIAAASIDWSAARPVMVKLTDFAFTPAKLSLRAGQPVRLTLSNQGTDLHDFAAPEFFAAATFRKDGAVPHGGKVAVAKDQTAEIDLVPGAPGEYPLECTEFLHTMMGMSGTITVLAEH